MLRFEASWWGMVKYVVQVKRGRGYPRRALSVGPSFPFWKRVQNASQRATFDAKFVMIARIQVSLITSILRGTFGSANYCEQSLSV